MKGGGVSRIMSMCLRLAMLYCTMSAHADTRRLLRYSYHIRTPENRRIKTSELGVCQNVIMYLMLYGPGYVELTKNYVYTYCDCQASIECLRLRVNLGVPCDWRRMELIFEGT